LARIPSICWLNYARTCSAVSTLHAVAQSPCSIGDNSFQSFSRRSNQIRLLCSKSNNPTNICALGTPNPEALKFLPDCKVLPSSAPSFILRRTAPSPKTDSADSKLFESLLSIEGVEMVTFGTDFITVTKHSESDWRELEGCIMSTLAPFVDKALAGDAPLIEGATAAATAAAGLDMKDPVVLDIVRVIDERVRPNLEADGGDVQAVYPPAMLYIRPERGGVDCMPYNAL